MAIKFLIPLKKQAVPLILIFFVSIHANSQDPFTELEKKAKRTNIQTKKLGNKIFIDERYSGYKIDKRAPIEFVPFDLKDQNGQPLDPNSEITLQNGKKIKAIEQLNEMNRVEKKINTYGYTLRNNTPIISKLIPDKKFLTLKNKKPLGPILSEQRLAAILKPELKIGKLILRPMKYYTREEQNALKNYKFSVLPNGRSLSAIKTNPRKLPRVINNRLMQEINKSWSDCWRYGDPSSFSVAVCANLNLAGRIYSYDVANSHRNPSSYILRASGTVDGTIMNNTYNVLQANGSFEVKSNASENSKIDLHLKIGGSNIYDFTREIPSAFEYQNSDLVYTIPSIEMDSEFDASLFTISCKTSINGSAGVLYGANIDKTYVSGYVRPFAKLEGTAEASLGVDILIASGEVGVRGTLSVIDGHVDLFGSAGIWSANNDQLTIFANLASNYDITFLKGKIDLWGKGCFLTLCNTAETNIASYDGIILKGNIFNWTKIYTVDNDTH